MVKTITNQLNLWCFLKETRPYIISPILNAMLCMKNSLEKGNMLYNSFFGAEFKAKYTL
jgi:hypothetical protein